MYKGVWIFLNFLRDEIMFNRMKQMGEAFVNQYGMAALQVGNVLIGVVVLNNLVKSLKEGGNASAPEFLFDVAVHFLQAAAMTMGTKKWENSAVAGNVLRLASIAWNGGNGTSTIPIVANLVDVVNHSVN